MRDSQGGGMKRCRLVALTVLLGAACQSMVGDPVVDGFDAGDDRGARRVRRSRRRSPRCPADRPPPASACAVPSVMAAEASSIAAPAARARPVGTPKRAVVVGV